MATLSFHKVDVLPNPLLANAFYIVKPVSGNIATIYVTDKQGQIWYRTLMATDVSAQGGGGVSAGTAMFLAG